MATDINIAGRLHSMATGNVVAGSDEILDDALGKKQSVINQELYQGAGRPQLNTEDLDYNRDNQLQFANRLYDSESPDGMGYKILRQGDGLTFPNQMTEENTVYEIRYDFDLNDAEGENPITIPIGCTLKFVGGSISNGALVLNNTYIDSDYACLDCAVTGTVANSECHSIWFAVDSSDFTDGYIRLVALANASDKPIFFENGEYNVGNDVTNIECRVSCDFNHSTINLTTDARHCNLKFSNATRTEITDSTIKQCLVKIVNDRIKYLRDTTESTSVRDDLKKYYGTYIQLVVESDLPNVPVSNYDQFDPSTYPGLEIVRNYVYNNAHPVQFQYEQFFVDELGFVNNEPFNDNIDATIDTETTKFKVYYVKGDAPLVVKNLNINITDNYSGGVSVDNYRDVGISAENCMDLSLEHITLHTIVTQQDGYRFFRINRGYNVTLNDIYSDRTPSIGSSSYVFSIGRIIGLTLNKLRVPDITTGGWGDTGCNYLTDVVITNCSLARIDTHYRVNNLTITDSEIGTHGLAVTGYGKIIMQRCNFYGRYAIRIRADYGCAFDGDLIIKDCNYFNSATSSEFVRGLFSDFNYHCAAPNRLGILGPRNIIAENVVMRGTGVLSFFRMRENNTPAQNSFSTDNQVRDIPSITVKNLDMATSDEDTRATYLYCHTAYDVYVVKPASKMTITIDGFKNDQTSIITGSAGVLVGAVGCNDENLAIVSDYSYPISIVGKNISCLATRVRGAVDEEEGGSTVYKYIKTKIDNTIYDSWVASLRGPYEGAANDVPVTYNFNECLVKVADNSETKSTYIKILFNDCTFDVSLTGKTSWYSAYAQTLFSSYENIFIINSNLTDELATALNIGTKYDDRMPKTIPSTKKSVGDMCFQNGVPTWWNGSMWIDATGERATWPVEYILTNMYVSPIVAEAAVGKSFSTRIVPRSTSYRRPSTIEVVMGSDTLTVGTDYTYDSSNGNIVVLGLGGEGGVTAALTITATATAV